jgi:hypothetical protein
MLERLSWDKCSCLSVLFFGDEEEKGFISFTSGMEKVSMQAKHMYHKPQQG